MKEVLDVVGSALKRVNSNHVKKAAAAHAHDQALERRQSEEILRRQRIRGGLFHDGRLDCVAGNGVMSELGLGDEQMDDAFESTDPPTPASYAVGLSESKPTQPPNAKGELSALPIVVLKNYDAKGAAKREAILEILANWSTALIENQVSLFVIRAQR